MSKYTNTHQKHISKANKASNISPAINRYTDNCQQIKRSKDITINCTDKFIQDVNTKLTPQNINAVDIDASKVTSIDTVAVKIIVSLKQQVDICEWQFSVSENSNNPT